MGGFGADSAVLYYWHPIDLGPGWGMARRAYITTFKEAIEQEHDVAITDVRVSPTTVTAGEPVDIEVDVENQGDFSETFDVNVYSSYSTDIILTQEVTDLASGADTTLYFTWDTTGVAEDTYQISAAGWVPGEVDLDDNVFHDGYVTITVPVPQHQLTIEVDGSGTTSPSPGAHMYDEDSEVGVDAIPDSGWTLHHWELDGSSVGDADPYTVTMDEDHTLKAVFERLEVPPVQYDLTIEVEGSGTTDPAPGTYAYDEGTAVDVDATPGSGSALSHWLLNGVDVGYVDPYTVIMDTGYTLRAVFVQVAPEAVHDVEAVSQTVAENEVLPGTLVDILVTVGNPGDFTESFDVTCYYDSEEIGTKRVEDLASGHSTTVTFTWDTGGVLLNGYAIKAWADSGEELAEVDEDNNWCEMQLPIFVIPEMPLGAITGLAACIAALAVFKIRKARQ